MRAAASSTGLTIEVTFSDLDEELISRPPRTKWPLILCGLFAMSAACAAVTSSPLGQRPSVRPYTDAAHAGVAAAEQGIIRLARNVDQRYGEFSGARTAR